MINHHRDMTLYEMCQLNHFGQELALNFLDFMKLAVDNSPLCTQFMTFVVGMMIDDEHKPRQPPS